MVLRKKPPGKLLPSAHAVEREYQVMKAIGAAGVPVPNLLALCEDDRWVPGKCSGDSVPRWEKGSKAVSYTSSCSVLIFMRKFTTSGRMGE